MALQRTSSTSNFDNVEWSGGSTPHSKVGTQHPEVRLRRVFNDKGVEEFELQLPITYRDDSDKKVGSRTIAVPAPYSDNSFTTDLTSVPALFTWLVPKSGKHLPAALVHDGLIGAKDGHYSVDGQPGSIDRIDADAVFRNAMHDLDVGVVRRWLVWAAVAAASLLLGARETHGVAKRLWYGFVVIGTVLVIGYLGIAATLDVTDLDTPDELPFLTEWWLRCELPVIDHSAGVASLPWINDGGFWSEVWQGLAAAIVIPLVLALLWMPYYRVGAIVGVALATLFHVTLVAGAVTIAYLVAEKLSRKAEVGAALGGLVVVAALYTVVVVSTPLPALLG